MTSFFFNKWLCISWIRLCKKALSAARAPQLLQPAWVKLWVSGSQLPWPCSHLPKMRWCQMPRATNLAPQSTRSRNNSPVVLPAAPQELRGSGHYGKEQNCGCGCVPGWPGGSGSSSSAVSPPFAGTGSDCSVAPVSIQPRCQTPQCSPGTWSTLLAHGPYGAS